MNVKSSPVTFSLKFTLIALLAFAVLAVVVTYPTAFRLDNFTVYHLYTDDLLESWTLEWDVHAMLSGPQTLQHIWDANIFYPYPDTLAFSEHLLAWAVWLLPVVLLGDTPIVSTNLGILLSTALTGWGTYLLVFWLTKNRWAGIVAGVAFAIAPYRLGHITQLHLISTHWLPFVFLTLARLIKFNRNRDLLLLIIFTNLQFFSVINYAPLVALGAALWSLPFFYLVRRRLSLSLGARLAVFALITGLLNAPVLRLYQQVSDHMGIVRTLGDAKVYGAYLVNYILPMGNSLLYGRLLGLPTHIDYQFPGIGIFISTFPGVVVILLALAGLLLSFRLEKSVRAVVWFTMLMAAVGFVLSFGANDDAFGVGAAPLVARLLPYPYLYDFLPILQGLRVPIRFALLTTVGLAILAGIGFAALSRRFLGQDKTVALTAGLVCLLMVAEHLPAPLPGVPVPRWGQERTWLRDNTPSDASIIELPYYLHTNRSNEEVLREYESAAHFRNLVNGTSGFKPDWLKALGVEFDTFPNWQAFDLARRFGLDDVVLHQNQFSPAAWDNITALLPGYLPSIEAMHTVRDDLILQLRPPTCAVNPGSVRATVEQFPHLRWTNDGPTTWIADPRRPSRVMAGGRTTEFLEPLFVLPGATVETDLPLEPPAGDWQIELANLGQTLSPGSSPASEPDFAAPETWQPVQVMFSNGASLQAMAVSDSPRTCGVLDVQLRWNFAGDAGETVRVELVDRFGRIVASSAARPQFSGSEAVTAHRLPLPETLPPGRYQLRVRFLTAAGDDIPAVSLEGAIITQPLALPIVIRPGDTPPNVDPVPAALTNGIQLVGVTRLPAQVTPGDWLRFTLVWQAVEAIPQDYTVFTQLLGPDGQVYGQHDNPPRGGWYPTSLWVSSETVVDDYILRVASDAPPGQYRLIVGMYDSASGKRALVASGGDFVAVGQVLVQPERVTP